ncbi:MAG TPA: xanthine dehydrogenase subunit D, partial [Acidimicrobiales bacterium]|nr:xanthine dehydrogenase subunit D [Acidimicrobiales bacterium]
KTKGEFAFTSDLWAEGLLWGRTLRSPHASARIRSIDVTPAWRIPGVVAVVTAADVPGAPTYGLDEADQPVFATDVVRYAGEPIAAVAADHPETARRAVEAILVDYEPTEGVYDPEDAFDAPPVHPNGNVYRHLRLRHGDPEAIAPIVVEGTYEVGMQDQAFMGPESGLAIPSEDGGVELFISTQWLHVDRDQVAACLALPPEKVRLTLGGVGGAFGAREDVSLQVHVCLLALKTGRPVRMVYSREESFHGHVHRHPARMWMRHHANADGTLVKIEGRVLLDGGAYQSTSTHVLGNATCFATGPYVVPNVVLDGYAVRTNNPPCGAMRGFGAVQACFAHESQMDKLAAACGLDPVEVRLRNAMGHGDSLPTGQVVDGTLPTRECIEAAAALPLPPPPLDDWMARPGGAGRTSDAADVRRGVGYAVGFKNLMYAEGADDFSTASCRLRDGFALVTCAAAEVGQGFVTLAAQIAREVLGIDNATLAPAQTATIGSAGSSSASRQTWMSGGAVEAACIAVRQQLLEHVAARASRGPAELALIDGRVVSEDGAVDVAIADVAPGMEFEATEEFHHRRTVPLDADGQGDAHVSLAVACQRAVVDVDVELGLVRVVQMAVGQDVGRALNPLSVQGQIEGGTAQGVGLAVMEEIVLDHGRIRNPSFTDYLIPTALDMPEVVATLIEQPEPGAPFGAKGVGEAPTLSSHAAIVAAIRDASGIAVNRCPVRPQDLA